MFSSSLRFCSVVRRLTTVSMSSNRSYESAVCKLNMLQSNKQVIDQIRKQERCRNIEDMTNYLERTGVTLSQLDQLSVIHVAGTKGKGSTSAMCESILRSHGYRTGFYSSPHLVAVRERVRLDGRALTEDAFQRYFHRVYDLLDGSKRYEGDMPGYFAFLTVLAFYTFLAEKVDVAVVEVGIGGIVDFTNVLSHLNVTNPEIIIVFYTFLAEKVDVAVIEVGIGGIVDYANVLRKVPVVGITALGLDHTAILGDTISEIAAAKAGIMKRGCRAFSVPQPQEAMEVLERVATGLQCPLTIAPKFDSYKFPNVNKMLQCNVEAYKSNASLAIQLAHAWMQQANVKKVIKNKNGFKNGIARENHYVKQEFDRIIDNSKERALANGTRSEVMRNGNNLEKEMEVLPQDVTLEVPYETWLGLKECRWPGRYQVVEASYARFYIDGAHTKESMDICAEWFKENARNENKFLIFGATGNRQAEVLMRPLTGIAFKRAYFVVPAAYKATDFSKDDYSTIEQKEKVSRCQLHDELWKKLHKSETSVYECMADVLVSIKRSNVENPAVLVTGSLHLVGAALSILDPNLCTYS